RGSRGPYCNPILNRRVSNLMNLLPAQIKKDLRVSVEALMLLMDRIIAQINPPKLRGYSLQFAVIITLYWLAAGMLYRICGNTFDVARSTVCDLVLLILNAIIRLARDVIRCPDAEEVVIVGENFGRMSGSPVFLQCAGVIDVCQLEILCEVERHDEYINQKLFYSIAMEAVVDHNAKFININVGFPGSCHDIRILRHSGMYLNSTYPPEGYFIIGDGGYISLRRPIVLVTPYRDMNLNEDQRSFKYHLSRIRATVERAFGLMQARWRALFHRAIEVKLRKAVKVITACAILHNICIDAGDMDHAPVPVRRPPRPPVEEVSGDAFRNLLCMLHNMARRQADAEQNLQ
ncbi:Protein ANTAGONIST OF LIKE HETEROCHROMATIN PROTEIN 1, partial [Frankliniella fusca]